MHSSFSSGPQLESLRAELASRNIVSSIAADLDALTTPQKIATLAGVVEKVVNESCTDAQVLLLDIDGGEFLCCVHSDVTLHYPTVLERGSAIVLQDVTVLPTSHRPLVIVCLRNIAALYEAAPLSSTTSAAGVAQPSHNSHHHHQPHSLHTATVHKDHRQSSTHSLQNTNQDTYAEDELELADDF